ncbi:MAG: hypothetical protein HWE14_11170 [Flavobacteriia bacterium]|nr:hypothetical protein [Flavobacteriia bacterium]
MKRAILLALFPLLMLSCIEGPELEQDVHYRVPDGKVLGIFYNSISPRDYNYNSEDSTRYVDSLVAVLGPTRTIGVRLANQGNFDVDTIYLPTIMNRSVGNVECNELVGTRVLLEADEWRYYDYSLGFEKYVGGDYIRYEGQDCEYLRISYP